MKIQIETYQRKIIEVSSFKVDGTPTRTSGKLINIYSPNLGFNCDISLGDAKALAEALKVVVRSA